MTIFKNQCGHLTYDAAKKLVRLDWSLATATMSADDYKHTLTAVADAVLAQAVAAVLVDVRFFRPSPAMSAVYPWRVQHIVPIYNRVVKRFAWLGTAGAELPAGGDTFSQEGETYQNRWFDDEAAAVSWATTNA